MSGPIEGLDVESPQRAGDCVPSDDDALAWKSGREEGRKEGGLVVRERRGSCVASREMSLALNVKSLGGRLQVWQSHEIGGRAEMQDKCMHKRGGPRCLVDANAKVARSDCRGVGWSCRAIAKELLPAPVAMRSVVL